MGGSVKWCKEDGSCEYDGVARNTFKEDMKYRKQRISLIQTLPNIINLPQPKPHTNDTISDSGYTGQYMDTLTTMVSTK